MDNFERFIETLMYDINDEVMPCEIDIACPFFGTGDDDHYCACGDCTKGMAIYATNLLKKKIEKALTID